MVTRSKRLLALCALAVFLTPTAAQAAGKSVFAGPPRKVSSLPDGVDLTRYFPRTVKVLQGRKVDFHFRGFHTVTFLGDSEFPPFLVPDGKKISGEEDAAGNPFWFNGRDRLVLNPQAGGPVGDGKVDNAAYENSGLPQGDEPAPYTVEFPRAGTFKYVCLVHPTMKGKVKVLRNRKRVPSSRRDEVRIAKEIARTTRIAKRRASWEGPGGANVRAGHDDKNTEILRFFPKNLSVPAGGSVRWFVAHPNEFHTITFGPREYVDPIAQSFMAPDTTAPQGGPPTIVLNPKAGFPSDPPGSSLAYDGTNHGNGFLNTGLLNTHPSSGTPRESRVTFSKPGRYDYLCLVHPDMRGTITVTS